MFEATLAEGIVLKKIIEAIKDLVTDVNIDATPSGIINFNNSFFNRNFTLSNGQLTCCFSKPYTWTNWI